MKADELRKKSAKDLEKELQNLLREQFNLRIQRSGGQLKRPHLMRAARHNIARVKTVLHEQKTKAE